MISEGLDGVSRMGKGRFVERALGPPLYVTRARA